MNGLRIDKDQELGERVSRLRFSARGEFTREEAERLLARTVWCRLAEPGDATACALIAVLGPQHSLDLLMQRAKPEHIADAARDAGSELTTPAIAEALGRWLPRLDRSATIADLDRAHACRLALVTPESTEWPEQLADLGGHTPILLWVDGDPAALSQFSRGRRRQSLYRLRLACHRRVHRRRVPERGGHRLGCRLWSRCRCPQSGTRRGGDDGCCGRGWSGQSVPGGARRPL